MTQQTKEEIYKKYVKNYRSQSKKEKIRIITIIAELTNHNRKHIIRKLNAMRTKTSINGKKRGRKSKYNVPILKKFILELWKETQFICSRRLKEAIKVWLPYSPNEIPENIKELLLIISPSSIERILSEYRNKYAPNRMCTTKPGSLIKKQIPIHSNKWDNEKPGFVEADTVAHGGASCSGSYVHSVVITDIATGWVETRAVWEKGQRNVHAAIMSIERSLPFPILGFDSDNGSEFINYHMLSYFTNRKKPVSFTRSRPYQKNDNAHVEQKNWTHVRQFIGNERFDNEKTAAKLNDLYENEFRIWMNYFMPSEQLKEKIIRNGKIYKIMSTAKTPYQRLTEKLKLKQEQLNIHDEIIRNNNPYKLIKTIKLKIKGLYSDYEKYLISSGGSD